MTDISEQWESSEEPASASKVIDLMDSDLQTSPPDGSDAKAAFRKPSSDASNRQYRRRSPASRLSSPEGSYQHDRNVSPELSRDNQAKAADSQPGKESRELDRDSSRNKYCRNDDSYRYSDRQSSRSSHGFSRHDDYVRHDKRANEDSKYDRVSSRSARESRVSSHSDDSRQESDLSRSKDYSRKSDKYSRDRYDGSGHRSREKGKESPSLEYHKYKDKDLSFDRADRRHGGFEEIDRDRRRQDRDARDGKGDYHKISGGRKGDYSASYEESRGHWNDSSSRRERDNDKYRLKEGYKSGPKDIDGLNLTKEKMKYDEGEIYVKKDRHASVLKELSEEKSTYDNKNQECPAKKPKLFSSGKGIDYDTYADVKQSNLDPAEDTGGQVHGKEVDISSDVIAAQVAALKAAELVNRNLVGAGHSTMTTEQKKKLLWGSKKNASAEESGHRWDSALFGDRERQEKFNKLMGMKGDMKGEQRTDSQEGGGHLQAEKQRELQLDLEKQYTAGLRRRDGRTVGLGL